MLNGNKYFRRAIIRKVLIFSFWIAGMRIATAVIAWVGLFKLVFSDSFFVTGAVLFTFLFGLAIGNFYFGKKMDQRRNELQSFLWLEFIIGISLLVMVIIFPAISPLNKFMFVNLQAHPYLLNGFKFLIIFVLVIVPATLMGATFPVLGRFFIQSSERASREVGNLYGINSFGAGLGCLLGGFVLLQILGIKNTIIFAAFLSFINTAIIKFLLSKIAVTLQIETEFYDQQLKHLAPVEVSQSPSLKRLVATGIAISGFLSTSYLILWVKSLIIITGNSSYSYYIPLIIFLGGLTIGAFFYPRFLERSNLFAIFAIIQILIGMFGIIAILLIPQLPPLNENLFRLFKISPGWSWLTVIHFYDAILLFLLPAILVGMVIPLIFKLYLTDYEKRGKTIGSIYAANFLGAIGGLYVTAIILIPHVGIQKSFLFLALINFLIGLVILLLLAIKYGNFGRTSLLFGAVATMFLSSLLMPSNKIPKLFENLNNGAKAVYVKEGINTTVTIYQHHSPKQLSLAANGVTITSTSRESLTMQRLCAHLPLMLHHNSDTVLAIGFRDGETLASLLTHDVKWIDCADERAEIIKAASLINGERYHLESNTRWQLIPMNGKYLVASTPKKYDVIINDIAHPAFEGNAALYSQEHFQACRAKLKQGGIICSVIPLFKMTIEDFKVMVNTFHSVFQTMTIWYPNNYLNHYAILIGSIDPEFKIDYKKISERMKDPGILMNLSLIGMDDVYEILDSFILGANNTKPLTEGVRVDQGNRPYLAFSCPKTPDSPTSWHQILYLLANYREPIFPYLTNIDSSREQRELVKLILDNYYKSTELVFNALSYELLGKPDTSLQIYRKAYMMNRFDRGAKRFFDAYYDPMLLDSPQAPAELIHNATIYYQKMEYEEAINLANKALAINPDFAPAYFALGINYEILGEFKKAREMYQQTLKLKPNLQQARDRLDSLKLKNRN